MRVNRRMVIERLKAGENLKQSGNTMEFANGDSCTAETDIFLREKQLVKYSYHYGRVIYSWAKKDYCES